MNAIGREREKEILGRSLEATKSKLIAVYGRRRVGKTFLIRSFYSKQMVFEISGLHNGSLRDQLDNFASNLSKQGFEGIPLESPKNWLAAFQMLEGFLDRLKGKGKKVLFFDELPWMATKRSKFLMAFENFWNSYADRREDLIVVICGSAASWMINKIVKNKGGLHNRISEKIRLEPFDLNTTEQFLIKKNIKWSKYDILQMYMTLGGIPMYLEQIKPGESVHQAIGRLCFSKDGFLKDEFNELYASLFENEEHHLKIVQYLSKTKKGKLRNEILAGIKMKSGGTFSNVLDELLESGFVKQYYPFSGTLNKPLYRLSDYFTHFYMKFMKGVKMQGEANWQRKANSPAYTAWSGFAFESICLQHTAQIKKTLGIPGVYTEQSAWRAKGEIGTQIDLVIDREDRIINACEMKFQKVAFKIDKAYADKLRNRINLLSKVKSAKGKSIHLTFISTFGVEKNDYYHELVQSAITMEALFE